MIAAFPLMQGKPGNVIARTASLRWLSSGIMVA
jgi:hypothetical protein